MNSFQFSVGDVIQNPDVVWSTNSVENRQFNKNIISDEKLSKSLIDKKVLPQNIEAEQNILGSDNKIRMVPINGGKFTLGSLKTERGRNKDEGPAHNIFVDDFWMAEIEVTWDLYELFLLCLDEICFVVNFFEIL